MPISAAFTLRRGRVVNRTCPVLIHDSCDSFDELDVWHQSVSRHLLVEGFSRHRRLLVSPEGEQCLDHVLHALVQTRHHNLVFLAHGCTAAAVVSTTRVSPNSGLTRTATTLALIELLVPLGQHVRVHELERLLVLTKLLLALPHERLVPR